MVVSKLRVRNFFKHLFPGNYDYVVLKNPMGYFLTLTGNSNDLLIEDLDSNQIKIFDEESHYFLSVENSNVLSTRKDTSTSIFEAMDLNQIKNRFYIRHGALIYLNCVDFEEFYLCNDMNSQISICESYKAPKFTLYRLSLFYLIEIDTDEDQFTFKDLNGDFLSNFIGEVKSIHFEITETKFDQIQIFQLNGYQKMYCTVNEKKRIRFLEMEDIQDTEEPLNVNFQVLLVPKMMNSFSLPKKE
jgi:hypothetical protein